MGQSASRVRESGEQEAEAASGDPSHEEESAREKEQEEETERAAPLAGVQRNTSIDATNDAAEDSDTDRVEPIAAGGVSYDAGPDRETLAQRYGMAVKEREATAVHRLESEHGSDQVQRWADEGMPVQTMGKPRNMAAFRQRQDDRPDAVPPDIERQNEHSVQRNAEAAAADGPAGEAGVPDVVRKVISKPGQPLPDDVREEMEEKLGEDFSDVQIHTGSEAAAAADALNARAFTVGNHIVFNDDEYKPETDEGKEILAHELTHVRQQNGDVSKLPAEGGMVVDPDPQQEKEAEQVGKQVRREAGATVQRNGTDVHIQRSPSANAARSEPIQREGDGGQSSEAESTEDSEESESETARVADVNSNGKSVGTGLSIRRMAANAALGMGEDSAILPIQRAESTDEVADDSPEEAETERVADINSPDNSVADPTVQRAPTSSAGTNSGDSTDTVIQREATATNGESGDPTTESPTDSESAAGDNVAEYHDVSEGDTLSEIANQYDIEDWRNIWYQNYNEIGEVPNIIFPTQTFEIPADEDAVPQVNGDLDTEEQEPAPERDLREDSAEATAPTVDDVDEAAVDDSADEEQSEEEADEEAQTILEAGAGISIEATPETDPAEPPEKETESPATPQEDDSFQQCRQSTVTEMDDAVQEDMTTEEGERQTNADVEDVQASVEPPDEEYDGAAADEQLACTAEGYEESDDFDLEGYRDQFIAQIEAATPDSMEAMEDYEDDEPVEEAEEQLQSEVEQQHETSAGEVEEHASEDPDPGSVERDEPDELDDYAAEEEPQVDEEEVSACLVPKAKSEEEATEPFEETQESLDEPREEAGFSEEDRELADSPNDEWQEAGEEKEELVDQCERAPEEIREHEQEVQESAEQRVCEAVDEASQEAHEERDQTLGAISEQKENAKEEEEQARSEIWSEIETIYEETNDKVTENLEEMEEAEERAIERIGERREEFEQRVTDIADDSSGFWSGFKETLGISDDFREEFEEARENFVSDVKDDIVEDLVTTVDDCMTNIQEALETGREKVEEKKEELKKKEDDICEETFDEIDQAFDDLDNSATAQTEELSANVTEVYEEELAAADEHMREKKEEVEESRNPIKNWLAGVWEDIKEIGNIVERLMSDVAQIGNELWSPLDYDWWQLAENFGAFIQGTIDYIADNLGDVLLDGLFTYLDLDLMRDADLDPPDDGFDDPLEVGKFIINILKAVFGGMFDYVHGRAEDAWAGEEVQLTGTGPESLGLTDEQVEKSSILDSDKISEQGGTKYISLPDVFKLLWDAGEDAVDWLVEMGEIFPMLWEIGKGEESLSALLDFDTIETILKPFELVTNMIINSLVEIIGEGLMKKLAALLGPIAAILKAAKKVYDVVMFVIEEAVGMIAVFQGYVEAAHGLIVTGDVSRAVEIFSGKIPSMVATLISFIMSLIGAAGRASENVTDGIMAAKERMDDGIDQVLLSKQSTAANAAPNLLSSLVKASDALVTDEGDGEGEAEADEQDTTERDEDEESKWQQIGQQADQVADTLDDSLSTWEDQSNIDSSPGEVIENFQVEEKMRAVNSTVAAEDGDISESRASHVLEISELESDYATAANNDQGIDVSKSEYVKEHGYTIRMGLVRQIAGLIGEDDLDDVWDEGSQKWEYDHQSVAGEVAQNRAEEAYESGRADAAGFAGAKMVEGLGGDDKLGTKLERQSAEQEIRNQERQRLIQEELEDEDVQEMRLQEVEELGDEMERKREELRQEIDRELENALELPAEEQEARLQKLEEREELRLQAIEREEDQRFEELQDEWDYGDDLIRGWAHQEAAAADLDDLEARQGRTREDVRKEQDYEVTSVAEQREQNREKIEEKEQKQGEKQERLEDELVHGREEARRRELERALKEAEDDEIDDRLEELENRWAKEDEEAGKITTDTSKIFEEVVEAADASGADEAFLDNTDDRVEQIREAHERNLDDEWGQDRDWVAYTIRTWIDDILDGTSIDDIYDDEYDDELEELLEIGDELPDHYAERFVELLKDEYEIDIEWRLLGTGDIPGHLAESD